MSPQARERAGWRQARKGVTMNRKTYASTLAYFSSFGFFDELQ